MAFNICTISTLCGRRWLTQPGITLPEWVIPIAVVATITGAVVCNQKQLGNLRARPTWEGKNIPGLRIYFDNDKKAKFYKSLIDDVYQRQREQTPVLPEGRPSRFLREPNSLFRLNTFDLDNPTGFCFDPNAARSLNQRGHSTLSFDNPLYLNLGGRSPLSGLNSNLSSFNFDTGGLSSFSSSGRSDFLNLNGGSSFTSFISGGRFSLNGLNF